MNVGKSFTYAFDDPDWFSKIWKPVLCCLIPFIGGFVLQGYFMNVIKNVANGESRPLYHMDFENELKTGFRWFLVQFIYALPIILVSVGVMLLMPVTMSVFEPGSNPTGVAFSLLGQLGISTISYILSAFYMFVLPIVMTNVAVKETFAAGFEFKEMFAMVKRNISAWLLVLAGQLIAGIIAPLGVFFFFIGIFVSLTYASLMTSYLAGQAYRESQLLNTPPQYYYPPNY